MTFSLDLFHGFLDGAAEVASADAVFDGDVARIILAGNLRGAVGDFDVAELRERNALARRGQQADVGDGFLGIAIGRLVAEHQIVALFALQNLAERVAADSGLNGVLNVGDVDLIAGGFLAVDGEIQIRLAEHAEHADDPALP